MNKIIDQEEFEKTPAPGHLHVMVRYTEEAGGSLRSFLELPTLFVDRWNTAPRSICRLSQRSRLRQKPTSCWKSKASGTF